MIARVDPRNSLINESSDPIEKLYAAMFLTQDLSIRRDNRGTEYQECDTDTSEIKLKNKVLRHTNMRDALQDKKMFILPESQLEQQTLSNSGTFGDRCHFDIRFGPLQSRRNL
jgi:hypothetical protein